MKRLVGLILFGFMSSSAFSASLNIDFSTRMGAPLSFQGYEGQAGTWNSIGLGSHNLFDLNGVATSVTANVSASYDNGIWGSFAPLLGDNIWDTSAWSVDLSGLTNGLYELIVYAPTNSMVSTGSLDINGLSLPEMGAVGTSYPTMVDGVTHKVLQIEITNSTLSLSGDDQNTSKNYYGLAGIQLAPVASEVPLPAAASLFGSALLGLGLARRR